MTKNYIVLNDERIVNLYNVIVIEKDLVYSKQNKPLYRICYRNQNGYKTTEIFDSEEKRNEKYRTIIETLLD